MVRTGVTPSRRVFGIVQRRGEMTSIFGGDVEDTRPWEARHRGLAWLRVGL